MWYLYLGKDTSKEPLIKTNSLNEAITFAIDESRGNNEDYKVSSVRRYPDNIRYNPLSVDIIDNGAVVMINTPMSTPYRKRYCAIEMRE